MFSCGECGSSELVDLWLDLEDGVVVCDDCGFLPFLKESRVRLPDARRSDLMAFEAVRDAEIARLGGTETT